MNTLPKALRRLAAKSDHGKFKHVAVVERGGAVVSMGYNFKHRHAEVSALSRLWPSERVGTRVLSIRFTKSGKLAMAKPCPRCQAYLEANGVKQVTYSDSAGNLQVLKVGQ